MTRGRKTRPENRRAGHARALNLVGIGASAGGVAALREFFKEIPDRSGIAFVVIMHLSPEYESQLAEVLQPDVRIPVRQVRERTRLEPDCVYVIPPDRSMSVSDGHLELAEFEEPRGRRSPIDIFFRALAEAQPDSVGVLLSGSGTDGVLGLKAIKEMGGILLAQSPDETEYDTMPRSAIATGLVDFVLPARELGARVLALRSSRAPWSPLPAVEELEDDEAENLRKILSQLHTRTGHDFKGYKESTILRRIGRRLQVTQTDSLAAYLEVLRSSPIEARDLLKDLLISVTNFFRDRAAFEALQVQVIPSLFGEDSTAAGIRIWVPGCATGEEVYSLAMLVYEQAFTLQIRPPIQIFATDLDEEAIASAREGLYAEAIVADVGDERLMRFFWREGAHYRVRKELRELIVFTEHDFLRDPPFSHLDLLSCRNLLIYLEKSLQDRVLGVFRYALRPGGYLFLGGSESVPEDAGFRFLDKKHRIYQRARALRYDPDHLPELPLPPGPHRPRDLGLPRPAHEAAANREMHGQALEAHAPPSVLVDRDHTILHVSDTANRYLEFPVGTPSANLLKAARPALRQELRTMLFQALEKGDATRSSWLPLELEGEPRRVQMWVAPAGAAGAAPLALVVFMEIPAAAAEETPEREETAARELEYAEDELGTARARLEEVLETSEVRQEELRAANEELQSINEEYRSTLEELETSKEELQSMNEELTTVNDQLTAKVGELAHANDDLRNLMAATQIPTLFLDRELRIKRFTPALQTIFNVMPVDEGRPLDHITHRLDYPELRADCDAVLDSLQPLEQEVGNGAGHYWLVRITPYRTEEDRILGLVVTLTEVTRVREAQAYVRESEERFRALVVATAATVWATDPHGNVVEDSPSWRAFTGQTVEERLGSGWLKAVHPEDRARVESEWRRAVQTVAPFENEFQLRHAESGGWRVMAARAVPLLNADGSVREWSGMNSDVTERKQAEESLRGALVAAERAAMAKSQFLATMSHELRTPLTAVIGLTDLVMTEVVGPVNATQQKHLNRIKVSAWHLVSIIDDVLAYSRSEAGRTEVEHTTIDLAAIVREVIDMLEIEATAKGIELRAEDVDRPEFAFSDGGKIRQIVTNLVGNAVKFTEAGEVAVQLEASGKELRLRVRDTGPGIPPDQLEYIFEAFVQVDASTTRRKGGAGLGLAVSRRLARLLGGDVELESTPGKGSTFTLQLPREPAQADPRPTAASAPRTLD